MCRKDHCLVKLDLNKLIQTIEYGYKITKDMDFKVILGYKIADFCVVSKRKKLQIYAMRPDASIWKENIKISTITYSPKPDIF